MSEGTERYGTHADPLKWALENSYGPVLELGMGYHSTPLLRKWCHENRRELTSGETVKEWAEKVCQDGLELGERHRIIIPPLVENTQDCPDWNLFPYHDRRWAVALVDQHPAAGRLVAISALKYQATFIVVHDTEQPLYFYDWLFQTFKHRRTFKDKTPWTTILSEFEPIPY